MHISEFKASLIYRVNFRKAELDRETKKKMFQMAMLSESVCPTLWEMQLASLIISPPSSSVHTRITELASGPDVTHRPGKSPLYSLLLTTTS